MGIVGGLLIILALPLLIVYAISKDKLFNDNYNYPSMTIRNAH
jgi:hypothetical protein